MKPRFRTRIFAIAAFGALSAGAEVSPTYYENLRKECAGNACCLESVTAMAKAEGVLPGANDSCFPNWKIMVPGCAGGRKWCERDKKLVAEASIRPLGEAEYKAKQKECGESACCLGSLKTAYLGKHPLATKGLCPEGYRENMNRCIDSVRWCEKTR